MTLGGQTLRSVAPPAAAPLRARAWRPMRVRHARRADGLSVWLDGVLLVSGVLLPGFSCSLCYLWLQPPSPMVAASVTYGCR